ncbi:MAG: amidohydrolase [Gemmatimonadales bacterium]|nr:MAG: amidohydrolase [Gemmatimonadales bacterium]
MVHGSRNSRPLLRPRVHRGRPHLGRVRCRGRNQGGRPGPEPPGQGAARPPPSGGSIVRRRVGPGEDRRSPHPAFLEHEAPDRILLARSVWTGVDPALGPLRDAAVAIQGDRIVAVGPRDRVLGRRGPRTVIVDLGPGAILPGFVDAHVHLQAGGLDLYRVDLRGLRSRDEFLMRIRDRVGMAAPGSWILGGGWDHHGWGGTLPRREWLDEAAPSNPVFLLRTDLHVGVASTEALRLAGVDSSTPDPDRGTLDRDPATGELTGILRERALELISAVIPPPTEGERAGALQAAALHALRHGVTQVHDMGALQSSGESWASLEALRGLHAEGKLPIRVSVAVPLEDRMRLAHWVAEVGGGDERLRWGAVKAFVDGSLGADTAWFLEDYAHLPGHRGGPITDLDELRHGLEEASALGLQPIVHAIGDAANAWLVEVYEGLCRRYAGRDQRLRIEHAQHLNRDTIARMGVPGMIVSMQPAHLTDDGPWAESRIGPGRAEGAYAIRSLLEAGARPAFGSDWTVAPLDPRAALRAAVTRRITGVGEPGAWGPSQRLELGEALRAHTLDAARAAFLEGETGSLEPGKRADLAIARQCPFTLSPEALISDLEIRATFVDGALAWQDDADPLR